MIDILMQSIFPILSIILGLVGVVLGFIGAWDKLILWLNSFKHKRNEKKLISLTKNLEKLDKLKTDCTYLLAIIAKKLFIFLNIVFLAILMSSLFQDLKLNLFYFITFSTLSFLAGFIFGNMIVFLNQIIHYDVTKKRLQSKIKKSAI